MPKGVHQRSFGAKEWHDKAHGASDATKFQAPIIEVHFGSDACSVTLVGESKSLTLVELSPTRLQRAIGNSVSARAIASLDELAEFMSLVWTDIS